MNYYYALRLATDNENVQCVRLKYFVRECCYCIFTFFIGCIIGAVIVATFFGAYVCLFPL